MTPFTPETSVSEYFRLTPIQKDALKKMGIQTLRDLLYHFPVRYGDTAETRSISSLGKGDTAVIFGKISGLKASKGFKTHITMATANVEDESGSIQCVWFNQPYIAKMTPEDALVRVEGKVSQRRSKKDEGQGEEKGGALYFSNPKIEVVDKLPIGVGDSLFGSDGEAHTLYPVYPESHGITSSWMYHSIQKIFKSGLLDTMIDVLPGHLLVKYHLPSLKTALVWMHTPLKRDDALSARKRFSFEEILIIQLGKQQARRAYEEHPAFAIDVDDAHVREFIRRFPFTATEAQTRAVETILSDMRREYAMSRLLEGDVGSGKTAVAAAAAYSIITSRPPKIPRNSPQGATFNPLAKGVFAKGSGNLQVAYMCPTEILATQHFESFIQYFSYMPIRIGLLTGSGCRAFPSKINPKGWTDISRAQLLKWVESGEIHVLIGTHALIQKSVKFKNLAFAIIDEQHRFGTAQRAKLIRKDSIAPHLLSMTATPIPRTLALTMYGDLDLTLLDQPPAGRKPIITELVLPTDREIVYEKVRRELEAGRQAYVICPRIDEPDPDKEMAINAKSVKEEAKRLKAKVFPEYTIGVMHSKMKPEEKDRVMADFKRGDIRILCATSVVEVGVNVPNATVIIVEGAERFGLSQLHQLRGRVMRSSHQPYCYVFTETTSGKSIERLRALQQAKNGFELAELDLAQRGPGELAGMRQWGVSDIAMEALKNIKMVEAAREEAARIIVEDRELNRYPDLKREVEMKKKDSHFE
jgi:ATP-dependent DNA helicase RecG